MNIIAVDDEALSLQLLMGAITEALPEASTQGFPNPAEALSAIEKTPCDVVFLAIRMEGMTGLELAGHIRERRPDTNIVFVTGHPEYAVDAFALRASDYLLKPISPEAVRRAMGNLRRPVPRAQNGRLRIQCFGNFEIFYGEKPLGFRRSKTKELLAYLVDRMGAGVTMGELAAVLWECGPDTPSRQSNLRNLISDLRKTLSQVGAASVIRKSRNTIAIDCGAVDCDYYAFRRHDPHAVAGYRGEYMAQYSWAELTTASLPVFPGAGASPTSGSP